MQIIPNSNSELYYKEEKNIQMAFISSLNIQWTNRKTKRKFAITKPFTTGKLKTENKIQEDKLYLTPRKLQIKEESRTQP